MPRFQDLRQAIGEDACLRVLTLDPDMLDRLGDDEADLVIAFDETDRAPADWVTVFEEAVTPVCSPGFAATHAHVLARPVADWSSLPFLRLARSPRGWATWHDWFEAAGYPAPPPRYIGIDDYIYLLEAGRRRAGPGARLASLHRSLPQRWDASHGRGRLRRITLPNRSCFARLTRRGRQRRAARRCLDALGTLTNEASRA